MHYENSIRGRSLFTEMWPASVALHHGLKAVAVPHSIFINRKWPLSVLADTFNGGHNGATRGALNSIFGPREGSFLGTSWYWNTTFALHLYRRWLGFRVNNDGGRYAEKDGEGRMCLPPRLLHPIEGVWKRVTTLKS